MANTVEIFGEDSMPSELSGEPRLPAPTLLPVKRLDFNKLLGDLQTVDSRIKALWQQIYDNALMDRENAYLLWFDLYKKVVNGSDEGHFKHGQTLSKYMERYEKANTQLLKLAELVEKARISDEENSQMDPNDLYARLEKESD